jgi:RNA polymerase sigma factor for flagellar operon FliA
MSSLISIESDRESEGEHLALWREWRELGIAAARDELIERHLPFARMMAASLYAKRHSDEFEFDDYLQFATIGLLDGIEHMSERQEQISVKRRLKNERAESMANTLSDPSRADSIFEKLAEISIGLALGYMLEESMLYLDNEHYVVDNQYSGVELRQMRCRVQSLVEQLPEQERLVIKYHYFNQTPFETVASQWNVTRGRVAQIHRSALLRLRALIQTIGRHDVAW